MTIHDTPKRSATMPKDEAKNVLPSGICTWPPSLSALKRRLASASLAAVRVSDTPLKSGWPLTLPSDASSSVSPMRKLDGAVRH